MNATAHRPRKPHPTLSGNPDLRPEVRFGWRALVAYSLPASGLAMLSGPLVVFLPNLYVMHHGLSLATVGAIFFVARLWDSASDLLVGLASDATRGRWGRRQIGRAHV